MVSLVVKVKIKEGKEKEAEEFFNETARWLKENEKTTTQYIVLRKAGTSSEFYLIERYADRDAWLVTHRSSAKYKEGSAKMATLLAAPPEITECEVVIP